MRKNIKKQVLDLISSMHEMLEEIHQQMIVQDFDSVKDSLSICYDGAVQIDTVLENSKDDCAKAITGIEEYAFLINQTFENLSSIDLPSPSVLENSYNTIRKKLLYVEHIIDTEIKVNYEILFLPYKASMWDSLESIWLAAKDDVNCQCFVMPVPYFDFNQNCEVSQMHWEADQMPTYVPITHYNDYNISQRKPDIIYFHNPYDGHNKITSVHPEFYSSKLKQYTDMLVYVPYFVTDTTVPEHLIELTGVYNADKVIVQSEAIKEAYAKFINKDKILALGSPKFDKVISCMKNKPQVPEEWKDIIQSKKVIFLNTHLMFVKQYREKAIEKLKYIFEIFKDRNDAVLLWRPHPLSIEATQAMSLELITQYAELLEYYKDNKVGIYDESADLHRAIAIADAYYGSMSSVLTMFGLTGKPIMVMDMEVYGDSLCSDTFYAGYLDGNQLWYSSNTHNGLYKFDINNGMTKFIGKFHGEENTNMIHEGMICWQNKLVAVPSRGKNISIYNIKTNEFTVYKLENNPLIIDLNPLGYKFAGIVSYRKWTYIIGCSYPMIIRFDIEKEEIDYSIDLFDEINPYIINKDDIYFYKNVTIVGESFMIGSCNSNIILEFDMRECQYKLHRVGDKDATYAGICFDGNHYWLCPRTSGYVTKWNKETGEIIILDSYLNDFANTHYKFLSISYFDNCIWAFPMSGFNKIIKINTETFETKQAEFAINEPVGDWKYYCFVETDKTILMQSYVDKKVLIYNKLLRNVIAFVLKSPYKIRDEKYFIKYHAQTGYLSYVSQEYELFSLENYIDQIVSVEVYRNHKQSKEFSLLVNNNDGSSGVKIHKIISKNFN